MYFSSLWLYRSNANNYDPEILMMMVPVVTDILEITVTTDNYPTETSVKLIDDNGTIVQSISAGDLTILILLIHGVFVP